MSEDGNSMQFPYIETVENYHSTTGFDIIEEDGKLVVKPKPKLEASFEKEDEYHNRKNKELLRWRERINEGKEELKKNNKITAKDLTNFIINYL